MEEMLISLLKKEKKSRRCTIVAGKNCVLALIRLHKIKTIFIASDFRSVSQQRKAKKITDQLIEAATNININWAFIPMTDKVIMRNLKLKHPCMVFGLLKIDAHKTEDGGNNGATLRASFC